MLYLSAAVAEQGPLEHKQKESTGRGGNRSRALSVCLLNPGHALVDNRSWFSWLKEDVFLCCCHVMYHVDRTTCWYLYGAVRSHKNYFEKEKLLSNLSSLNHAFSNPESNCYQIEAQRIRVKLGQSWISFFRRNYLKQLYFSPQTLKRLIWFSN